MTITQMLFIRNNYKFMTHIDMAANLNIKETQVSSFCRRYNLKKIEEPSRLNYNREPIPVPSKTGKYWPPDHTNKSREDYISFYLSQQNIDYNGPTGHGDICFRMQIPGFNSSPPPT